MIDINLTEEPVDVSNYTTLLKEQYPALFFGTIIKNEYDNKRVNFNKKYSPIQIIHKKKTFKGVVLTANPKVKELFKVLKSQEKNKLDLKTYENLLSQYNFSCKDTYALFEKNIYPIDFNNLKSVCVDSFKDDKKIFQHLLDIDENNFDFQKFTSLKLFILTY